MLFLVVKNGPRGGDGFGDHFVTLARALENCPVGADIAPKREPRWAQRGPRGGQEGAKRAQEAPKVPPGRAQERPMWALRGSNGPEEAA